MTPRSPGRLRPALAAFLLGLAIALAIGLIQGEKLFAYDAAAYWTFSSSFTSSGHFSLLSFGNPLRGYALPLVFFAVRGIGELFTGKPWLITVGFNSILFSLIGTVLLPRLAAITWPRLSWGVFRRLLLLCLLLPFWRGYISYPLSDFPALAAGLLAVVAISSPRSPGWMAVAGASAVLALEIRPAYIVLLPALLVLILLSWREGHGESWGRRLTCLSLFLIAAAAVAIPQSLVEHHRVGSYSPIPGGSDLARIQYTGGLEVQRYDTYIGGTPEQAQMFYRDPHTAGIVASLPGGYVGGTGEYLEIVARHPVTMLGVFLRHIVNGLDQRYSTPYIERLHSPSEGIRRFIGFLIVFLAMLRLLWPAARRALGEARWRYPSALALASATSLASAVETRFLLPVFVLCATVTLAPNWRGTIAAGRYRDLAIIALAGVVFVVVVLSIVRGATDNLYLGGAPA